MPTSPPPFTITDVASPGLHTLVLSGEMDQATAPQLEARVAELCHAPAGMLVLDLRRLLFIDSSGLRAILLANETCQQSGCQLQITPGPESVQNLFEQIGLAGQLPFVPDGKPDTPAYEPALPRLFLSSEK